MRLGMRRDYQGHCGVGNSHLERDTISSNLLILLDFFLASLTEVNLVLLTNFLFMFCLPYQMAAEENLRQ